MKLGLSPVLFQTQLALSEHHHRKIQLKEKLPAMLEEDEEDNGEKQIEGGEEL